MRKLILSALLSFSGLGVIAQGNQTTAPAGCSQGTASYYHNRFEGRKTATGEIFSNDDFTAASNRLPLGTYVKVTNLTNGKIIYVKINDRMAASNRRALDMAETCAVALGYKNAGTAQVKIEIVNKEEGQRQILAQREAQQKPTNQL